MKEGKKEERRKKRESIIPPAPFPLPQEKVYLLLFNIRLSIHLYIFCIYNFSWLLILSSTNVYLRVMCMWSQNLLKFTFSAFKYALEVFQDLNILSNLTDLANRVFPKIHHLDTYMYIHILNDECCRTIDLSNISVYQFSLQKLYNSPSKD